MGLAGYGTRYPSQLSGGMQQRPGLARARANDAPILLMDEPFAALDALTRRKMQDELLRLWEDTRFTVMFVTHSIAEAIKVGNRILLMSPHPGRVKAELNSTTDPRAAADLEHVIHEMLFAHETDEEEEHA